MPPPLSVYRTIPFPARIAFAVLLPLFLIAGMAGVYYQASTWIAMTGERCALGMPLGTIVALDTAGLFAQRISRNNWRLSSDVIVDNCYVSDHMQKTKDDCAPNDWICRVTFSPAGTDIDANGETWTKTGIDAWQNENGDVQTDLSVYEQRILSHSAPDDGPSSGETENGVSAGCCGDPSTCADIGALDACAKEPLDCAGNLDGLGLRELSQCGNLDQPCSSSSAPRRRGIEESSSSSSSAPACTAVYYKFDEGAGTTTLNALGSAHPGSVDGAAWATDHAPTLFQNTGALAFDGSNKVEVPTLPPPGTPFTFSVWVKAPMTELADQMVLQWGRDSRMLALGHHTYTTFSCEPDGSRRGWYDSFFNKGDTSFACGGRYYPSPNPIYNIQQHAAYYLTAGVHDRCEVYDGSPDCQIPHGGWVHLAFINSANVYRLYANGVNVSAVESPGGAYNSNPIDGLTIGNINNAATWNYWTPSVVSLIQRTWKVHIEALDDPIGDPYQWYQFPAQGLNGLIDDVRVYDRALTATEVAALAAGEDVSFNCTVSSASSSSSLPVSSSSPSSSSQSSGASSSAASSAVSSVASSAASTAESSIDAAESSAQSAQSTAPTGTGASLSSSSTP